ncbi:MULTISPECIES: beta-ketoacyl-[acyl-carrier-protein] synthase family protein [Streptomyces]|uniref:beta-ketoacyl-[acyl-carrier-protein] synthase family protein n=1 Tax=Streptomyces TaxID=1883 RepID=UPI001966A408|nr:MULTISPECIES: beta-ketoacyl-[acyl-carrier-protein] synthase family protein [Streptomyces]QRX95186.1 beta-ketoacyl-[acyl-carrier-protein] synthase family protein [Streptomyces noursei]UJB45990.1 beta-ketoacyl-[acyl-carrier-protein] synthase family protein [Streptomyces sp. A1-5]
MRCKAAVTGIGMITPGGLTTEATWATVCQGQSVARTDPDLAGLPVDITCRVDGFDADAVHGRRLARRLDRFTHLALAAAQQAVRDAKLEPGAWNAPRVAVVLGVGGNSMNTYFREFEVLSQGHPELVSPLALPRSVPNMAAAEVAIALGARGPNFTVASACASGATALAVAASMVTSGACDIALAGGAESGLSRMTVTGFQQMHALSQRTDAPRLASRPFDVDRDGFVLAEGAAVLVLERPQHALRRGADQRALLGGHACTCDAYHPVVPHPEGIGVEHALRTALKESGLDSRDVGHVNAHGTSTPVGDTVEARALHRIFGPAPPPVTAPKSILGHSLGAAGAIEAALTVLTQQHQLIPPTANLHRQDPDWELDIVTQAPRAAAINAAVSNSFGFGGHNTVLVFVGE